MFIPGTELGEALGLDGNRREESKCQGGGFALDRGRANWMLRRETETIWLPGEARTWGTRENGQNGEGGRQRE